MRVVFRTNAGAKYGIGHIKRCIRLAKGLLIADPSMEIVFLVNKECVKLCNSFTTVCTETFTKFDLEIISQINPDIIILDSYEFELDYIHSLKNKWLIAVFDDINRFEKWSGIDILINGNIYAETINYQVNGNVELLLGLKYLLLDQFKSSFKSVQNSVLITTGGADFFDLSVKLSRKCLELGKFVRVVVGNAFRDSTIQSLNELANQNDKLSLVFQPSSLAPDISVSEWVICASGVTSYEALLQRKKVILFSVADNQNEIYNHLINRYAFPLGVYPEIDYESLQNAFDEWTATHFLEVDYNAADRISYVFSRLYNGKVLRNKEDCNDSIW